MKLPQTGRCQCGEIRYEIAQALQLVYTCHCTDCQRLTSSAFSLGLVAAETAFIAAEWSRDHSSARQIAGASTPGWTVRTAARGFAARRGMA